MKCKYYKDDFCVNADSPYVADFCPVTESEEICIHNSINKKRVEELIKQNSNQIATKIYKQLQGHGTTYVKKWIKEHYDIEIEG